MDNAPPVAEGESVVLKEDEMWLRQVNPVYAPDLHVADAAFRLTDADRRNGGTRSSGALGCYISPKDAYEERPKGKSAGTWGVLVREAMEYAFWVIDDHANVEDTTGHASLDHRDLLADQAREAKKRYKDAKAALARAANQRGRLHPTD